MKKSTSCFYEKLNIFSQKNLDMHRVFYLVFTILYILTTFLMLYSCNLVGSRSVGGQSFEIGEVTYTKEDIISGAIFRGNEHIKVTYPTVEEAADLTKAPHVKACSIVVGKLTLVGTGEEASLITATMGKKEFTSYIKDGVFQLSINLRADEAENKDETVSESKDKSENESTLEKANEKIKSITITAKVKGKKSSLPVILSASLDS